MLNRSAPSSNAPESFEASQITFTGNARAPVISPDGKFIVYLQTNGGNQSLWVHQTATGGNVEIVPASQQPSYATISPNGELVHFLRRGGSRIAATLWTVPLLGGEPRKVSEMLSTPIAWSPDGQQFAFLRDDENDRSTALVIADKNGERERQLAVRTTPDFFVTMSSILGSRPAWSPDGKRIAAIGADTTRFHLAVVAVDSGVDTAVPVTLRDISGLAWQTADALILSGRAQTSSISQLWRVALSTGTTTRITNDVNDYYSVSATQTGDRVVTSRRDTRTSLWVADSLGRSSHQVAPPTLEHAVRTVTWSGRRLLYGTTQTGEEAIAQVDVDTGKLSTILSASSDPTGSSDGQTIVFVRDDGLYRSDGDGRHVAKLDRSDGGFPFFTPDGRSIVFTSFRDGVQAPYVQPIDGSSARRIVEQFAFEPVVSPDGRQLAFLSTNRTRDLVALICDFPACKNQRTIPAKHTAGLLRWTPDSRSLAFVDGATRSNIWLDPLDGRPPRQLTQFTDGVIEDFAWSHDGKRLAMARSNTINDIVLLRVLQSRRSPK